jgi:hypothetical protein
MNWSEQFRILNFDLEARANLCFPRMLVLQDCKIEIRNSQIEIKQVEI